MVFIVKYSGIRGIVGIVRYWRALQRLFAWHSFGIVGILYLKCAKCAKCVPIKNSLKPFTGVECAKNVKNDRYKSIKK